jgi:hypothetical protein
MCSPFHRRLKAWQHLLQVALDFWGRSPQSSRRYYLHISRQAQNLNTCGEESIDTQMNEILCGHGG